MNKVDKSGQPNYHRFDLLSNEELEILLQAFFAAPDAEQMDYDAIMYISELLAEREGANEETSQENVEIAKAEFFKHYYPLKDEKTLYDFDDDEQKNKNIKEKVGLVPFHKRLWRGFASAAAVFVLFLFVGTVTAYALGYNPVQYIGRWNNEHFWLESVPITQELANTVAEYDNEIACVPKWLPDGYVAKDLRISEQDFYTTIRSDFYKDVNSNELYIDYRIYSSSDQMSLYEKDSREVIEYVYSGITHYIMNNLDSTTIVWYNGNMESSIVGNISLDEAKKIINSIYGE